MNLVVQEEYMPGSNPFSKAYLQNDEEALSFFNYSPFSPSAFPTRVEEIESRSFPRYELAQVIRRSHEQWEALSPECEQQLERFISEESAVVVGGQQAGLLMGPLYTIYKALTIIQVAREQEQKLQRPVIPLFWIAGEDHDFQEINHVYLPRPESAYVDKSSVESKEHRKLSASQRSLEKEEIRAWLKHYFTILPQTEFTESLATQTEELLETAQSYVDYFAKLMSLLFAKYGLLLVNSDDHSFRKLQTPIFVKIIHHYTAIFEQVQKSMEKMRKLNYAPQVVVGENPALLFIYENNERLLLEKKADYFQTKDGMYTYSEEELLLIAQETPWRLSNNVITRPFMQESLFPTLAFVGGPGEIAYWALYKNYFEQFGLKLPIIVPRTSITLIEKSVASVLEKRKLSLDTVFSDFAAYRERWLKEQDKIGLEQTFAEVKEEVNKIYQPVLEKIESIESGLKQLGEKNKLKIMEQIEYLEKRSSAAQNRQHEAALRQFDRVEQALLPQGVWQERIYNPFTIFNKHGMILMDRLLDYPFAMNGKHKFVYL